VAKLADLAAEDAGSWAGLLFAVLAVGAGAGEDADRLPADGAVRVVGRAGAAAAWCVRDCAGGDAGVVGHAVRSFDLEWNGLPVNLGGGGTRRCPVTANHVYVGRRCHQIINSY
jgi:hypothetical protein